MKTVKVNVWQDKRDGSYEFFAQGSGGDSYNKNISEQYRLIKIVEIDVPEPEEEKEWQWLYKQKGSEWNLTSGHYKNEQEVRIGLGLGSNPINTEFKPCLETERLAVKKTVRKEVDGTIICSTTTPNNSYLTICNYLP